MNLGLNFVGDLCETFYRPCSVEYNQCEHNSTCGEAEDGSFTCECAEGRFLQLEL